MRWIFLSLVLMNAMFFVWRFVLPANQPQKLSASAVEVAPQIIPSSETITLLEEVSKPEVVEPSEIVADDASSLSHASVASVAPPSASSVSGEMTVASAACYWIGVFASDDERTAILARLTKLNVSTAKIDIAAPGGLRHWVYLPPQRTRAESAAIVQSLKVAGVDSYVISEGEHRLGVSLGLFSQRALADEKMADLQRRGLNPVMDTYERAANQRWLIVNKGDIDAVGDNVLSIMLKNKADVKVSEKKCN